MSISIGYNLVQYNNNSNYTIKYIFYLWLPYRVIFRKKILSMIRKVSIRNAFKSFYSRV